jgi:hypothetical protein
MVLPYIFLYDLFLVIFFKVPLTFIFLRLINNRKVLLFIVGVVARGGGG